MTKKDENDKSDNLLSRWSRRKQGLIEEEEVVEVSSIEQQEIDDAREAEFAENRKAAEEIDLDSIDEESDLSIFMKEGVPEVLKKAALAKLWRSNPVFANVDGLVDYDDNFADPKLIMKTFTSAYQIGKGYLKDIMQEAEESHEEEEGLNISETDMENGSETLSSEEDNITMEAPAEDKLNDEAELAEVAETIENEMVLNAENNETEIQSPKVSLRQRLGLYEQIHAED